MTNQNMTNIYSKIYIKHNVDSSKLIPCENVVVQKMDQKEDRALVTTCTIRKSVVHKLNSRTISSPRKQFKFF